jgi:single-stranded-DNA-specific exonuclease
MTENIFCQAEEAIKDKEAKILIAISPDGCLWSEGLIGLAAGKLSEKYYRPVIVIANVGGNNYKASGRSIAEFNMIEAINSAAGFLTKYGGHPMACGFSLQGRDNLSGFCDLISKIAEDTLAGHDLLPTLAIDAEIELADINLDLMRLITQFSPFGQDNPQPVFSSRGLEIKEIMFMGSEGKHIKWRVNQAGGKPFSILMFSAPDNMRGFSIGDIIDVAYILDINQFNGRQEIQLKAIDIKKI